MNAARGGETGSKLQANGAKTDPLLQSEDAFFFSLARARWLSFCTPCTLVGINEMFAEGKEKKKTKQSERGIESVRK